MSAKWTCTNCQGRNLPNCELCRELGTLEVQERGRNRRRRKKNISKQNKVGQRIDSDDENGNGKINVRIPTIEIDHKEEQNGTTTNRKKTWSALNGVKDPLKEFVRWVLTAFDSSVPTYIYAHAGGHYGKNK